MTTITKFTTDSGIIGDGITDDSALLLSGTATANSTVKVYDGTTLLGSATANSSGAWGYTTGTLSDGAHSFTAATDTGGSTGAPSTTFPDASTTGVRDGVTLKPSGDITITTAGAVVSGLDITGNVVIAAPNVTLVDCKVTGNVSLRSTGAVVEHCTVVEKIRWTASTSIQMVSLVREPVRLLKIAISAVLKMEFGWKQMEP
ncbi:Ig-like domain-containing protein [Bradyrhizobium sp. BR 1432]|uniref:Ig-like domain-containing protein n=1 Tax=Bradyrhizobium sp. BR 1432 TaxID=3447966 RepID=UPI003EE601E8